MPGPAGAGRKLIVATFGSSTQALQNDYPPK